MSDDIHTETHHGFTISILYDDYPSNPREDDNIGTMICFHPDYSLGDKHTYLTPAAFVYQEILPALPVPAIVAMWYEYLDDDDRASISTSLTEDGNPYTLTSIPPDWDPDTLASYIIDYLQTVEPHTRAIDSYIFSHYPGVILPLYLYDHSGITMSTSKFSCPWDSGQVGWIYAPLSKVTEEYGTDTHPEHGTPLARATRYLTGEVTTYDDYLTNNIHAYTITDPSDDIIDSCYDFYPEHDTNPSYSYCLKEARSMLAYHLRKIRTTAALARQYHLSAPACAD